MMDSSDIILTCMKSEYQFHMKLKTLLTIYSDIFNSFVFLISQNKNNLNESSSSTS